MARTNTTHAAKQSWARANKLHAFATGHYTNQAKGQACIPAARGYLAANKTTLFDNQTPTQILDTPGITKKHKILRSLINDYNNWLNKQATFPTETRPSKGHPEKPPRAGAPIIPDRDWPNSTRYPNTKLLRTLAALAKTNGGLKTLQNALKTLEDLQL